MFGILSTILLSISSIGVCLNTTTNIENQNLNRKNEISINSDSEKFTNIEWHNNNYSIENDFETLNLFNEYDVNFDEASSSTDVLIQDEYIEFDEVISLNDVNESNVDFQCYGLGDDYNYEEIHNKGYIRFITKIYTYGIYDGGIVYHVEVTAKQEKSFMKNNNDNLIIRHGNNSVTLNHPNYPAKGKWNLPCTIYFPDKEPINSDQTKILEPNYSSSDGGVYYTFRAGGQSSVGTPTTVCGYTTTIGDYYLVATSTTEVQAVYIHNISLFADSLSLSFGPIGVSINTGAFTNTDIMEGSVITLKGYDRALERYFYSSNPQSWNFDNRYYFSNEGLKYTTLQIDDLHIDTKRLRCGYIEEKYINLSPNRYNAGDAYLELKFDKPIYEMSTYLSFWSDNEGLDVSKGDYAFIQYLDKNGNWINYLDILKAEIPTNKDIQKHFECDFIEGTYGIKFIAHKNNPDTDRNKGRICIGNMSFVNWKVNI